MNEAAAAKACYLRGEVHRLRGGVRRGRGVVSGSESVRARAQPGWALLRLAQGNADAAAAAIRRAIGETTDRLKRAGLLPGYAEILIAVGDLEEARLACAELEAIAAECSSAMLEANHGHARGAVDLAAGDASTALVSLRRAAQAWKELEAPYEAARARVLVGQACRELGDEDAFSLELEAARGVFEQLGAAPILRVWTRSREKAQSGPHMACRRVSWRCCGWSRRARATGRSPPSS